MIFWFAGFIALAVLLGNIGCGSHYGPCRAAEAATVFGAFEWLLWLATTAMSALGLREREGAVKPVPHAGV